MERQPIMVLEETFERGPSGSSDGFMYQIKWLAHYLLKALLQPDNQFNLATEMKQEDVGKYDDVIYLYLDSDSSDLSSSGDSNILRSILLQSKYTISKNKMTIAKGTLLSTKDDDFSLVKYFHSYLDKVKSNSKLGNIEHLVLATNRRIDKGVTKIVEEASSINPIIKTDNGGLFYRFKISFLNELKDSLKDYHCNLVAKEFINSILCKRDIHLLWNNNILTEIQSAIFCHTLEFQSSNDKQHIITLKKDVLEKEFVSESSLLKIYRKELVKELKIKSKLFIEQMKNEFKITLEKDYVFDLKDLSDFLNKRKLCAFGDVKVMNLPNSILSDGDIEEFSKLFILAVEQPNVDDMDHVIKKLLSQHNYFKGLSVNSAFEHLISELGKWLNNKTSNNDKPSSSNIASFLNNTNGRMLLGNIAMQLNSSQYIWMINRSKITFDSECLIELRNSLNSLFLHKRIIQIITKNDTKMFVSKLHQALLERGNFIFTDFIFMDHVEKMSYDPNIFSGFVFDCSATLVDFADDSNIDFDFTPLRSELFKDKILIFVTSKTNKKLLRALNSTFDSSSVTTFTENISLAHVSSEHKNSILTQNNICLQGNLCSISYVLNTNNFDHLVDIDVLSELANNTIVTVGKPTNTLLDLPVSFCSSHQEVSVHRLKDILSINDCIIAVSGCDNLDKTTRKLLSLCGDHSETIERYLYDESDVDSKGKIIIFNTESTDFNLNHNIFKNICKEFLTCVVYWVETNESSLFLRQIYSPYFYIKKRLLHTKSVFIEGSEMLNILRNHKNKQTSFYISYMSDSDTLCKVLGCTSLEMDSWFDQNKITLTEGQRSSEKFDQISQGSREAHWFKYIDDGFMWIKSVGSLDLIRENANVCTVYREDKFVSDVKDRLVIISNDAGMGKSTFLTSMCQYFTKSQWVIRIDFKETAVRDSLDKQMQNYNGIKSVEDILMFITRIEHLNLNSSVAKFLLKNCLEKKDEGNNRLMFILDGFDEVPPILQNTSEELLNFLVKRTTCKIYVAIRHTYAHKLEDRYSCLVTKLDELSNDEQSAFLVAYLFINLCLTNNNLGILLLKEFASQLLKKASNVFKENLKFIGVPLHLQLISGDFLSYIQQGKCEQFLNNIHDITMLFEQFIETKFNTFFRDKSSIIVPSYSSNQSKNYHNQMFYVIHTRFAFKYLFPQYVPRLNLNVTEDVNKNKNDLLLIGILQFDYESGEFLFVHRTFCEYFCAQFLTKSIQHESYRNVAIDVLSEIFCDTNSYDMLTMFINFIITSDLPLHKAIINNDVESFNKLMCTHQPEQTLDCLQRSALHLAAQNKNREMIIVALLCANWSCLQIDVFGRTPLHYAASYGTLANILQLLIPYVDVDIYDIQSVFTTSLDNETKLFNIFSNTICEQSTMLQLINKTDNYGNTVLDYSIRQDNFTLWYSLISYGANCHSMTEDQRFYFISYFKALTFILQQNYPPIPIGLILSRRKQFPVRDLLQPYIIECMSSFIYCGYTSFLTYVMHHCSDPPIREQIKNVEEECFQILDVIFDRAPYTTDDEHLFILQCFFRTDDKESVKKYLNRCLVCASRCGHLKTFKYMISLAENEYEQTLQVTSNYMVKGLSLDIWVSLFKNINFYTYISLAIQFDRMNIVEYIWDHYQHLTVDNKSGDTALMYASQNSKLLSVKYFCKKTNNVNIKNREGKTALHLVSGEYKLDIIKHLIQNGCNINETDYNNKTVLDYALKPFHYEQVSCVQYFMLECSQKFFNDLNLNESVLKILNAASDTVNDTFNGTTLLHKAVEMDSDVLVRHLLSLGANPNVKDKDHNKPIDYLKTLVPLSVILLQYGTRLNFSFLSSIQYLYTPEDEYLKTHFDDLLNLFSSKYLSFDIVKFTEKHSPLTNLATIQDNNGQTLIHRAAKLNDLKALELISLYQERIPKDAHLYCEKEKTLLSLSLQDDNGDTPLHIAVRCECSEFTNVLLANGAKYNIQNNNAETPIQCCKSNDGSFEIKSKLNKITHFFQNITENSNEQIEDLDTFVNVRDKFGKSALHWAIQNANIEMANSLIKKGANVDAHDDLHQTPLHCAAEKCADDLVYFLLAVGATFNYKDKYGKTPSKLFKTFANQINIIEIVEEIFKCVKLTTEQRAESLSQLFQKAVDYKIAPGIINTHDRDGNTLLGLAVKYNCLEAVHFVLQNGGIYNRFNINDQTNKVIEKKPTIKIIMNNLNICGLLTFIDELFQDSNRRNCISLSTAEKDISIRECIVNARNSRKDLLLHSVDDIYLAKWLVKHSKQNINTLDKEGRTPLMRAVMDKRIFIMKVLCEGGANINVQAYNGETAVHMAIKSRDINMARYLILNGGKESIPLVFEDEDIITIIIEDKEIFTLLNSHKP